MDQSYRALESDLRAFVPLGNLISVRTLNPGGE